MIRRKPWSEIPLIRIVKRLIDERPAEAVVVGYYLSKAVVATCYNIVARKMGWRTARSIMDTSNFP